MFVAIEGADGVGTTTHAKLLFDYLEGRGIETLLTREPSPGPYGELIRRSRLSTPPLPAAELTLAFAIDRLEYSRKCIEPALHGGWFVVADRCCLSSMVYQHKAGSSWAEDVNRHARQPDLVLVLLATPAIARERMAGRERDANDSDAAIQNDVHERYGAPYTTEGIGRVVVHVDASESIANTQSVVRELVAKKLGGMLFDDLRLHAARASGVM